MIINIFRFPGMRWLVLILLLLWMALGIDMTVCIVGRKLGLFRRKGPINLLINWSFAKVFHWDGDDFGEWRSAEFRKRHLR